MKLEDLELSMSEGKSLTHDRMLVERCTFYNKCYNLVRNP